MSEANAKFKQRENELNDSLRTVKEENNVLRAKKTEYATQLEALRAENANLKCILQNNKNNLEETNEELNANNKHLLLKLSELQNEFNKTTSDNFDLIKKLHDSKNEIIAIGSLGRKIKEKAQTNKKNYKKKVNYLFAHIKTSKSHL